MMFFVYILCSKQNNKYYIGQTQNLEDRVLKHNSGEVKSTKPYVPWEMVYFEIFENRSLSYKREQEIKRKKSRKYVESLINNKRA